MTVSTFRRSSSDRVPNALTYKNPHNGVNIVVSCRDDGDMHPGHVPTVVLERRRQAVLTGQWTQLAQWHSADVVEVCSPGEHDGAPGDVIVTTAPSAVLGIWTGDCAPIVLAAADGSRLVAAHAGWRGLVRGVLREAVHALGDVRGATVALGPMIGACCYEFSVEERDAVADALGIPTEMISGSTTWGTPALDMDAAVCAGLTALGINTDVAIRLGGCTGCCTELFSHRMRRDPERFVTAAVLERAA